MDCWMGFRTSNLGISLPTCAFRSQSRNSFADFDRAVTGTRRGPSLGARKAGIARFNPVICPTLVVMPQSSKPDRSIRAPKRIPDERGFEPALRELARLHTSDLTMALQGVLKTASETIGVARASAWFFAANRATLGCRELFQGGKGRQSCAIVLESANYPRYFAALAEERMLVANDACRDPKTSEFTEGYLKPLGITSMLDVPIWHHGEMV